MSRSTKPPEAAGPAKPRRAKAATAGKPAAKRSDAPEREQCVATTAKGRRCRRKAATGSDLCPVHLGAPVGRPSKLDDDVASRILEILRAGGYAETAAAAAGIGRRTFFEWLERGDPEGTNPDDAPFREFRERVDAARAEGESRNVALIARAAAKDWKAAAWMLERQYPDRWSGPRGRTLRSNLDLHSDEPSLEGDGNAAGGVVDDQLGPDGSPL